MPVAETTSSAIHFAVPVVSTAMPRGINDASRNTVFQLTALYASSTLRTPERIIPIAPVRRAIESLMSVNKTMNKAIAKKRPAHLTFLGRSFSAFGYSVVITTKSLLSEILSRSIHEVKTIRVSPA